MKTVVQMAFVVLGAVLIGATVQGCGSSAPTSSLVGRWEMIQTIDGGVAGTTTLVFQKDGSMRMEIITPTGGLRNIGQWTAEGTNLTFTFSRCETLDASGAATPVACMTTSATATYTIAADTLTLMTGVPGIDVKATTVFQRK